MIGRIYGKRNLLNDDSNENDLPANLFIYLSISTIRSSFTIFQAFHKHQFIIVVFFFLFFISHFAREIFSIFE